MEPKLVSYLVYTTLMLNPTLRAVLIHLNSVDVTSLLAGILPHLAKPKGKAKVNKCSKCHQRCKRGKEEQPMSAHTK